MKSKHLAAVSVATLSVGLAMLSSSAGAQDYGAQPPQNPPAAKQAQADPGQRKINVSRGAQKALSEFQSAVLANDRASIPAKMAAAQAVLKTPEDRYFFGQMQLKAAATVNDEAGISAAVDNILGSNLASPQEIETLTLVQGKIHYNAKRFDQAATAFERVLAANPNEADATALLIESKVALGRKPEAVALLRKGIAAKTAAGQKAEEIWYKRAVGLAYEAKDPTAIELSRQWVAAYPTTANWREALRLYRSMTKLDDVGTLDVLRLARATGAIDGDTEYQVYAYNAATTATAREAQMLIDQAAAAGKINPSAPEFKEIQAALKQAPPSTDAGLAERATSGLAATAARPAMRAGDALFGAGQYAKAAELYGAALTKTGADVNLLNLRLGMALALAGDKVRAADALGKVGGAQAETAKYWLVYANGKA